MIEITQGTGPIILGLPHTGTDLPEDIRNRLNDHGQVLADTDWHIHNVYSDLLPQVTAVRTPVHRYVIDVNRGPEDESLYPGQNTTGLCPVTDFDGHPIYRKGQEPETEEVQHRLATWHAPYHTALAAEIDRVKALHGCAILYDCHSIRSHIPHLFSGQLPDFNIGTNSSRSCAKVIETTTEEICRADDGYSCVLNGRFKGGWTTRHYGRPDDGVHAIQMELAQSTYMIETPPWSFDQPKADRLCARLSDLLTALQNLVQNGDLQ